MYTSNPSINIRRRLNRHATTILLGGIFMFFSLSFFMAMCKVPCETSGIDIQLMEKARKIHDGHRPISRNYESNRSSAVISSKLSTSLVILILSGPEQIKQRDAIRNSWLSETYPNVTVYFSVGTSGLETNIARLLQNEKSVNNDLLFLPNVRDSYHGLTNKLAESFKWLFNNVDFQYVLKCDDDSFVRVDQILFELKSKTVDRLYWGFFDGRANVKKTGQWAENNFVLCDKYIPHARGGGYVLSCDLVSYIASNLHLLQKFNSEDISIGTWLGPLKISREHEPKFDTEYKSRGCNNQYIITHKQSADDMKEKWSNLKTTGKLCTKEIQIKTSYIYNWKALPSECCIRNNTSIP